MTSEVHPAPASNSAVARPASGSRRSVCRAQVSTSPRSGGEAKRKASWAGEKAPRGADEVAVCQNLVPLVNIKIAGKWMFIPLKNGINRYII